jgi:hypothetical protein
MQIVSLPYVVIRHNDPYRLCKMDENGKLQSANSNLL